MQNVLALKVLVLLSAAIFWLRPYFQVDVGREPYGVSSGFFFCVWLWDFVCLWFFCFICFVVVVCSFQVESKLKASAGR